MIFAPQPKGFIDHSREGSVMEILANFNFCENPEKKFVGMMYNADDKDRVCLDGNRGSHKKDLNVTSERPGTRC